MCKVQGVPKGGFSNWLRRPPSAREQEDGKIAERMVEISQQHKGRSGSPHIHQQLHDEGVHIGRTRVIRVLK